MHKLNTLHVNATTLHYAADSGIAAPVPQGRGRTVDAVVLQDALVTDDQVGCITLQPLRQRVVPCTPMDKCSQADLLFVFFASSRSHQS